MYKFLNDSLDLKYHRVKIHGIIKKQIKCTVLYNLISLIKQKKFKPRGLTETKKTKNLAYLKRTIENKFKQFVYVFLLEF